MAIDDLIQDATRRMHKSVEAAQAEFGTLRTGRASTALLDRIQIDYYGQTTPLKQLATVNSPESRMLTVQPFDKGLTQAIEKAIRDAGLGLNPATQGNLIRVPLPALSEERRKELVKVVHKLAEEGRVAVRHARTETMSKIKKLEKVPEDDKARAEKDVQKLTDEHIKQIDGLIHSKEAEIMEV